MSESNVLKVNFVLQGLYESFDVMLTDLNGLFSVLTKGKISLETHDTSLSLWGLSTCNNQRRSNPTLWFSIIISIIVFYMKVYILRKTWLQYSIE